MAGEYALLEVGVLFAAVALVGVLARALRQSVIPFYILAGMVLSPYVAGRLTPYALAETEFVELGAELGIVFLLLFLGFEFNVERLLQSRGRIWRAGTVDLVVNFGLGFVLGYAVFRSTVPAILVAGIVYISSSAIITKSLLDLEWIANDEADPMLGTLVYEDLVIAIYLVLVSALLLGGGSTDEAARSAGLAVGFIVALVVLVQYGTPLFERAVATDTSEFLVLRTVGITVLVAGAALAVGVSEAVAAFFVGMAFSPTDRIQDLERLLEPVRDVFAAVFFVWIGLVTDPLLFLDVASFVLVAVLVTAPAKLFSGYLGGRIYDLDARRSTRVALGMVTRGEFSLVIAALALSAAGGAIPAALAGTIYAFAVGYVVVMSLLGTTLMQSSARIEALVLPYLDESDRSGATAE